jgi:hypothetical protein
LIQEKANIKNDCIVLHCIEKWKQLYPNFLGSPASAGRMVAAAGATATDAENNPKVSSATGTR